MILVAVISDTKSHLASLREALDRTGVAYKLQVLDTDLGALCHFRKGGQLPDLVLVNGMLTFMETPSFIPDLQKTMPPGPTRIAIMDALDEERSELEQLGISLFLAKPLTPASLKALLDAAPSVSPW